MLASNFFLQFRLKRALDLLNRVVSQKRVVVTGPSASVLLLNQGDLIDSYDIVIRLNNQWPIPTAFQPHLGYRMDVLFHSGNNDFPIDHIFCKEFDKIKLALIEGHHNGKILKQECKRRAIPVASTFAAYRILKKRLKTFPNTGTVALWMLLQTNLIELYVTGISFFTEPYYPGYSGDGAAPEHWNNSSLPTVIWNHDLLKQKEFAKEFCRDPRFCPDKILLHALGKNSNYYETRINSQAKVR